MKLVLNLIKLVEYEFAPIDRLGLVDQLGTLLFDLFTQHANATALKEPCQQRSNKQPGSGGSYREVIGFQKSHGYANVGI